MPETTKPTTNPRTLPDVTADPAIPVRIWERARKVATTRVSLLNDRYDIDGHRMAVTAERMLPAVVDKPNFADVIQETRLVEAREDAANFGATPEELRAQEEAEDPERWDGLA